jgi:hypothetical protein
MVYGLFRALPGEPSSFATVAREKCPANMTPASGRQDHTFRNFNKENGGNCGDTNYDAMNRRELSTLSP